MNAISVILFIIGFVILCACLCVKHSNFLGIRQIVIQHFCVLKGNPLQLIGIFFAPLLLAIGLVEIKCIDGNILINLGIVPSILVYLCLLTLGALCSVSKESKNENYKQLLKETFNTTIFELMLCLLLFFISFIALVVLAVLKNLEPVALKIVSGVIYYLTMITILNVLVVIKRIKVIFDNQ